MKARCVSLLLVIAAGCSSGGRVSDSTEGQYDDPGQTTTDVVSAPEAASSTATPAQESTADLSAQIDHDRQTATEIGKKNGSCIDKNEERCITDVLLWIAPDSPAIEPAPTAAEEIERVELERFYAGVAAAEAGEQQRQLDEFYAGVAQVEAEAEQRRLDEFYATVERNELAASEQAEAEAIQIGENLVSSTCGRSGGYYQYWIDPPRARVSSCNEAQLSSGGGTRTGAVCGDGWISSTTGRGACSHHGGVDYWTY